MECKHCKLYNLVKFSDSDLSFGHLWSSKSHQFCAKFTLKLSEHSKTADLIYLSEMYLANLFFGRSIY